MTASVRALHQAQAELRLAQRRADEAEKIQKDLQSEGVTLMKSLDEMRPKIVELTNEKLDLADKVDSLQSALKSRDSVIANLESTLDELRDQKSDVEGKHKEVQAALERERMASNDNASELQKAFTELQDEFNAAQASIKALESERRDLEEMASRQMEELHRLSASVQNQTEQIGSLRSELDERNQARDESQEFLEQARTELEAMRSELAGKDEEIERLREAVALASTPTSPGPGEHNSFNDEMLSAIRQQHSLEMSNAQSEIRRLDTAVFQAEAKAHTLQKQVSQLEDQISQLRGTSSSRVNVAGPGAGGIAARPLSRNYDRSDELRRASFTSNNRPSSNHSNSSNPIPPSLLPSNFDGLSPETRHKRRVSLSMLKARIDSESAGKSKQQASALSLSRSSPAQHPGGLPPVPEPDSNPPSPPPPSLSPPRRTQFLDETHVFWCHACRGDLVIL
ncbi:hypothetical protein C8Q75DRAFT_444278 [Abortiporus biennis]|nr:hypothetical protein C8Q75DRAFT_444278 [Abortiporus biennis]